MAITIPDGCWRQPTESVGVSDTGDKTFDYVVKGSYAALETLQGSLGQGDEVVSGWLAKSWNLQKGKGGSGTLTITCAADAGQTDGQSPEAKPLKELWKIHSVRNDVSVMAYCGVTPGGPLRVVVEKWLAEKDAEVANAGNYRENGEVVDVATKFPPSAELIAKMKKGVETVVRFYSVLIRQRIYAAPPPDCLDNTGYVDAPPSSAIGGLDAKKPGSLASKLDDYEWLKMQDDCDETSDGKWARTESWWGIKKDDASGDHPWDPDLYGRARWPMPYIAGQGGANNGGGGS